MHEFCHRCDAELPAGDFAPPFCPQCGAPQLILSDYSEPLSTNTSHSTGALPPPLPNPIDWESATRCALIVAGVAAVLNLVATRVQFISPLSLIWIITASLTTLALYQRRRPLASMNVRIGARIGTLVGVLLGLFIAVSTVIEALIARFGIHSMAEFDQDTLPLRAQINQIAATPNSPLTAGFLKSPEFFTSILLVTFGIGLAILLVISIFGGAVGGLLRTRRLRT